MKILVKYYRLDRSHLGNSQRENQCITVRQRTTRYSSVHFSALFMCTFFSSIFHSCRHFHVALFSCYTIFLLHFGQVAFFPCYTFSVLKFFVLHSFRVAIFLCCTFSISYTFHFSPFSVLHFFDVAPCFVLL